MFTDKDLTQFAQQQIPVKDIEQQINNFVTGFPYLPVMAPATAEKGILRPDEHTQHEMVAYYDQWQGKRCKFVPASGAATRMFKALFEAMEMLDKGEHPDCAAGKMKPVTDFFENLTKFAFYPALKGLLTTKDIDLNHITEEDKRIILHTLLDKDGLMYGILPKGLLAFHTYKDGAHTAFEEHLMEGALYGSDGNRKANLHFTVSPEHRGGFEQLLNKVKAKYSAKYGVDYSITFSEQKKSTDTIAVDIHNRPFRDEDGSILFRPGGHGALLENLNDLDTDLIFIKNIDNVVPERNVDETVKWKKILAGILLKQQQQVFAYLSEMDKGPLPEEKLNVIINFIHTVFCVTLPEDFGQKSKQDFIRRKLNRPIRVCGIVKNEGEPGGGPFIAKNTDGSYSLQIAESSQIDMDNPETLAIFNKLTHFNPVDIVCGVKDYKGNKFDLLEFRDPATGFISLKSKNGKDLKAQELPGLWNGAMSDWSTIFVEVPLITFNPVKTVNDLLRPEHQ